MKAFRVIEPGSEAKVPAPVWPAKYLSNRRLMMPSWASSPAISCRVCGDSPAPTSSPLRSVGSLPAISSAGARRWPARCAGTSSVPYVGVQATTKETLWLAAATCCEDPEPDTAPVPVRLAELHATSTVPTTAASTARYTVRLAMRMPFLSAVCLPLARWVMSPVVYNPGEQDLWDT